MSKILLIDDEVNILKIYGDFLNQAGYDVESICNPADVFERLKQNSIDVVVTDIIMPIIDGKEILTHIRHHHENMPVVVMSAIVDVEEAVDVMRKGAFDYLPKPIKQDKLIETVQRALRYRECEIEKRILDSENEEYQQNLEDKADERLFQLEKVIQSVEQLHFDTVRMLASAINEKEPYLSGHSERVMSMATELAREMQLSEHEIKNLEYASLLHDVGKIAIPDQILNKTDDLTKNDFERIQQHPVIGQKIVSQVQFFLNVAVIIRFHHEHFDGSGYPDCLVGNDIPIESRIISVADAFDAMTFDRPHRSAMQPEDALIVLRSGKNREFDPNIVDLFVKIRPFESK